MPAKREVSGRDWCDMTRADFDTGHDLGGLFDLEPAQVPADDGHGTGDLPELAATD